MQLYLRCMLNVVQRCISLMFLIVWSLNVWKNEVCRSNAWMLECWTFDMLNVWSLNASTSERLKPERWPIQSVKCGGLACERLTVWSLNVWKCEVWRSNDWQCWSLIVGGLQMWKLTFERFTICRLNVRTHERLKFERVYGWMVGCVAVCKLKVWTLGRSDFNRVKVYNLKCERSSVSSLTFEASTIRTLNVDNLKV